MPSTAVVRRTLTNNVPDANAIAGQRASMGKTVDGEGRKTHERRRNGLIESVCQSTERRNDKMTIRQAQGRCHRPSPITPPGSSSLPRTPDGERVLHDLREPARRGARSRATSTRGGGGGRLSGLSWSSMIYLSSLDSSSFSVYYRYRRAFIDCR